MRATAQTVGMPLSMGIVFSLMGSASLARVPRVMFSGLTSHGVPAGVARTCTPAADRLPVRLVPRLQPAEELLGPHVLSGLSPSNAATWSAVATSLPHRGAVQVRLARRVFVFSAAMCLFRGAGLVAARRQVRA